jgi:hypothetical protein
MAKHIDSITNSILTHVVNIHYFSPPHKVGRGAGLTALFGAALLPQTTPQRVSSLPLGKGGRGDGKKFG